MSERDLTGIWQGLYSYPRGGEHVSFTATLIEFGGALHGTTHEGGSGSIPGPLGAGLSGRRLGRDVSFVKRYDAQDDALAPIAYDGQLSADDTEIEGRWTIAGFGSGTFLMIRPEREAETAAERRVERV